MTEIPLIGKITTDQKIVNLVNALLLQESKIEDIVLFINQLSERLYKLEQNPVPDVQVEQ